MWADTQNARRQPRYEVKLKNSYVFAARATHPASVLGSGSHAALVCAQEAKEFDALAQARRGREHRSVALKDYLSFRKIVVEHQRSSRLR
jgi:hypothetical protein